MIDKEVEVVADLETTQMPEQLSMAIDSSVLQNQNGRSQGAQGLLLQKKLRNLRSIKLSRTPSLKPSRRKAKNRSNVFSDAAGSPQSISSEMSTWSDTSTENLQNSATTLARGSSFKPVKNLRRISSLKFKNPLMRKSSGGTQMNNLKKSRMARPASSESSRASARHKKSGFVVGPSGISSSDADSSSPNFSKETQFQASPHTSESSYCSSSETRKRSVCSKPNSKTSPGQKSPVTVSTKSNKCSMRKDSDQISQVPDSSVQRATCSSALKGSKFPDIQGLLAEGTESEGVSGTKVCPFTYCSLHGHRHANVPPLKRLISIRRRMLKTQRGMTPATQSPIRVKRSGKIKEDQRNQMVGNGHGVVHETTAPLVEKLGRELFSEIYVEPETKPSGTGTYSENGENSDFSDISEKLLGETSNPRIHLEESLHTVEQHALVSLPASDGLSPECCSIGTDLEATNTDRKEERIAAADHNEGAQSTCTDNLSNSDAKSVGKSMEVDDSTTVKPPDNLERPIPDEVVESVCDSENNEISSASDCQALEEKNAANENKNGSADLESRDTNVSQSVQAKDQKYIRMWRLMYKHAVKGTTANVENQLALDGQDKEEQVEDTNTISETNNLSFSEADEHTDMIRHGGDQNTELCHYDAIKLVQEAFDNILLPEVQDRSFDDQSFTSVIRSDQEALGQIREDGGEQSTPNYSHSSEDSMVQKPENTGAEAENISAPKEEKTVSKVGDKTDKKTPKSWSSLKKFILLKRFVKAVEKVRNLNYRKPQYLPLDPDADAEKVNLRQQKTEERKNAEEWMLDYALQQVISKLPPAQQRRVALLVEAFESVLPFPEIKTSHKSNAIDSTNADVQVCNGLSVQSADCTGNMLCPEKSFNESLALVSDVQMENQQSPVNFYKLKESSTDNCCVKTELDTTASEAINEDQKEKQIVSTNAGDGDDKIIIMYDKTDCDEIKDAKLCDETSLKRDEHGSTSYGGLVNETVQEASEEVTSVTSLGFSNINSKAEYIKSETNKLFIETGEQSDSSEDQITDTHADTTADNLVISFASMEPTEEPVEAREEVNGGAMAESGFVQGFPPLEESHSNCNTDVRHGTQLEKQKYTNLWFLVYKHMVSSIDAEDGDKPLDGAEEEQGVDINRLPGIDIHGSGQSLCERDQEMSMKNHYADNKKIELRHIEAIKLQVEKAIDEIVLPENQDESDDNKSSTRDLIPDQPPENKVDIEGKPFISTCTNSGQSDNATIQEEEKGGSKVEDKPHKKMSKNWSNLKKMILLNRFIKALENVKKFNPQEPRYLPLESDPEAEKVRLKQQNMDERKNSEEWMLDYALQQAVARLTPARKRKVSLLVEAFETVIPNNGVPNPFKPQVTH